MAAFVPRTTFPAALNLPRSYFLGHHAAGLSKMKTMLSSIDLILECRDYRVPLTSRNPLFESALAGRERLLIYTKRDLGSRAGPEDIEREELLKRFHSPQAVLFSDHRDKQSVKNVLKFCKSYAQATTRLTGTRLMVVGMPNVGKSSLLNALRMAGVNRKKAAFTGAQPGITRKIASGVKIVDPDPENDLEGVYLVDTPGVFVPFVPDSETMLKLALVGSVKDTVIPPTTLCDYLLFQLNLHGIKYPEYCESTNEVSELLEAVCQKTGRLMKGGAADIEAAALWLIQRWRTGHHGRFVLDEVDESHLKENAEGESQVSMNQLRKQQKEVQRAKRASKQAV